MRNPIPGNVGIGIPSPSLKLDISGGTIAVRNDNSPRGIISGDVRMRCTGSTSYFIISVQDGTGRGSRILELNSCWYFTNIFSIQ